MTFKDWIIQYAEFDGPVGDFAYDVHRDKDFPKANSYNAIRQHIEFKITDTDKPLELFEICWAFYKKLYVD